MSSHHPHNPFPYIVVAFTLLAAIIVGTIFYKKTQQPAAAQPTGPQAFITDFPFAAFERAYRGDWDINLTDLRSAAFYDNAVYLATFGSIVKLDPRDGRILAMSNPDVIKFPNFVTILNGKLFAASIDKGIYQIDLASNRLEHTYDKSNGLQSLENIKLDSDSARIWVSTYTGFGIIEPAQTKITFFDLPPVNTGCAHNSTELQVFGNEVWGTITAHGECQGGLLRHELTTGNWTFFGPTSIDPTLGEQIHGISLAAKDNQIFISYDKNMSVVVIKKFNARTAEWSSYPTMPDPSSYARFTLENKGNNIFDVGVNTPTGWVHTPFKGRKYFEIIKNPHAENYFLLSSDGLERYTPGSMPQQLIRTPEFDSAFSHFAFTPDKTVLVTYAAQVSDYDGAVSGHNLIVYDDKAGRGFTQHFVGERGEIAGDPTDQSFTLETNGDTLIYTARAKRFEIDLKNKKITKIK